MKRLWIKFRLPGYEPLKITILIISLSLGRAACAEGITDNNVRLYGALVAEPCVILPGEEEIQLDFGTVIDKYLYLNKRTLGQRFEIHLAECDLSLGKAVKVTFVGTENTALRGLLSIDSSWGASGIAIGLETMKSAALPLNKASHFYPLQAGSTRIALKAYVQGEPEAIAQKRIGRGPFSATATFRLEYE
ncbi:TPA: type 1 fimbrial protein [Klebsiella aerogenes]|nr:type 1 fimbrial protein [Klebsiella aerogenes]HEJ0416109.1 type 1 fimbrial protein [Klebsiella aerogenes]